MTWKQVVNESDVARAFQDVTAALENTGQPLYVVVDLLTNPQFPLLTTVHEAIGPYRNPC